MPMRVFTSSHPTHLGEATTTLLIRMSIFVSDSKALASTQP
jgi:hypothetical protein